MKHKVKLFTRAGFGYLVAISNVRFESDENLSYLYFTVEHNGRKVDLGETSVDNHFGSDTSQELNIYLYEEYRKELEKMFKFDVPYQGLIAAASRLLDATESVTASYNELYESWEEDVVATIDNTNYKGELEC